jgi:hypothetical protein
MSFAKFSRTCNSIDLPEGTDGTKFDPEALKASFKSHFEAIDLNLERRLAKQAKRHILRSLNPLRGRQRQVNRQKLTPPLVIRPLSLLRREANRRTPGRRPVHVRRQSRRSSSRAAPSGSSADPPDPPLIHSHSTRAGASR